MKLIKEIKQEWKTNPLLTGFMGITILIGILSYIKPSSASGILSYVGLSIANFTFIALILLGGYWVWWRKKR